MTAKYPAIQRPDGRWYRPRKIEAVFTYDDDQIESGVIVFGTHDINRARRLADRLVMRYDAHLVAVDPVPCWIYRSISCGSIYLYPDDKLGRAAVQFSELVETGVAGAFAYAPDAPRAALRGVETYSGKNTPTGIAEPSPMGGPTG